MVSIRADIFPFHPLDSCVMTLVPTPYNSQVTRLRHGCSDGKVRTMTNKGLTALLRDYVLVLGAVTISTHQQHKYINNINTPFDFACRCLWFFLSFSLFSFYHCLLYCHYVGYQGLNYIGDRDSSVRRSSVTVIRLLVPLAALAKDHDNMDSNSTVTSTTFTTDRSTITTSATSTANTGAVPDASSGINSMSCPGLASRRERLCSLVEHVLAHRSNNTHSSHNKNNSSDNCSGDSGKSSDGGGDCPPTTSKPTPLKPRSRHASMPRLPDSTDPLDVHIMQCLLGQTSADAGIGAGSETGTGSNGSAPSPPSSLLLLRELRGYQWEGVSWLTHLRRCGLGGIVAGESE